MMSPCRRTACGVACRASPRPPRSAGIFRTESSILQSSAMNRLVLVSLLALVGNGFGHSFLVVAQPGDNPEPTIANATYGPHERTVIDFWKGPTDKPAPLVVFIHGGGFRQGDKSSLSTDLLKGCLA